jgi:UDP-glucose 4-epimerase
MSILLTGGLGFIGSHVAASLLENGHDLVLVDNLSNSTKETHARLQIIAGRPIPLYIHDVRDEQALAKIFVTHPLTSVLHFAGLKSVSESEKNPLKYFSNNVLGTIRLLEVMQAHGVFQLVFSSSATVYGIPHYLPYDESHPTNPINVYGHSKLQVENILTQISRADARWGIACLRYFNPLGAHASGLIGEFPNQHSTNLMPNIIRATSQPGEYVTVYGDDFNTADGTAMRDYIHIVDLAEGHIAALNLLTTQAGIHMLNLGSGTPHSVLEVLEAFGQASQCKVPRNIGLRRAGDLPIYYASANKANAILQWKAKRTLVEMCDSAWNFVKHQQGNR